MGTAALLSFTKRNRDEQNFFRWKMDESHRDHRKARNYLWQIDIHPLLNGIRTEDRVDQTVHVASGIDLYPLNCAT